MAAVYPPVDCTGIEGVYGNQLEAQAMIDYYYIKGNKGEASDGTLQCFCTSNSKDDPDFNASYKAANGEAICQEFSNDVLAVYFWTTALSYLLIGINYILRTVCIMLVDWIGFDTETVRLSKTTTITFLVQFFNSAFLLLMVNADMSEQPCTFGLTSGTIPDFNSAWFRSVGDIIVAAMLFNVYYPILELAMYWALRALTRCMDRGCKYSGD